MRLAFLGTPEVAAGTLRALVLSGHDVRLVVTRRDARRGRGGKETPSPVKAAAASLGLQVAYDAREAVGRGAELGVVVAYGRLIKPDVLAELPMVNVHFSLLPRWRGAAPVERAVLAGDSETGVCLMQLEAGLDTGPLYACRRVAIGPEETVAELSERLGRLGTEMLIEGLEAGLPEPVPQSGEATYAAKVDPAELRLDWGRPAEICLRAVRVGRAWSTWRGRRLIVRRARLAVDGAGGEGAGGEGGAGCPRARLAPGEVAGDLVGTGDGPLLLVSVQQEGRAPMAALDWARGARPLPGERLGL